MLDRRICYSGTYHFMGFQDGHPRESGLPMPLSTDIRLPKSQVAKFPDRCVVCGQEHPDATVKVSTRALGWWTWVLWLPGQVPACSWCGARLRRQHLFRWLLMLV